MPAAIRVVIVMMCLLVCRATNADAQRAPTYYGLPIDAAGVAFVLDVSGSMENKDEGRSGRNASTAGRVLRWGLERTGVGNSRVAEAVTSHIEQQGTKLGAAKRELGQVIMALPTNSNFRIITFGSQVTDHGESLVNTLQAQLRIGRSMVQRGAGWYTVQSLQAEGGTPMAEAMEVALRHTDLFTIFLVSDGRPTTGDVTGVVSRMQQSRGNRRARIHTVGIGPDQDSELLCRIARENNGVYIRDGQVRCSASPCADEPMLLSAYSSGHPQYHSYVTRREICKVGEPGCTQASVYRKMISELRFQVPTLVLNDPVTNCGLVELGGSNMIRTTANVRNYSATNHTVPGHIFYPGAVVRRVVQEGGVIWVETHGVGIGDLGDFNVGIGPALFSVPDALLAAQF